MPGPRRSGPITLGDALKRVLGRIDKTGQLSRRSVENVWGEVAGERISEHTAILTAKRGELVVGVDSATWANELSLMAEELKGKVNSEMGNESIRTIRFTVSKGVEARRAEASSLECSARRYGGEKVEPLPLNDAGQAIIERSLEAIEDPTLRDVARRATLRDLERKKGQGAAKSPQGGTGGSVDPNMANKP